MYGGGPEHCSRKALHFFVPATHTLELADGLADGLALSEAVGAEDGALVGASVVGAVVVGAVVVGAAVVGAVVVGAVVGIANLSFTLPLTIGLRVGIGTTMTHICLTEKTGGCVVLVESGVP